MGGAKIGEGVVIHLHATAQPTVGIVRLGQPSNRSRTPHTLHRGVQPQRQQNLRRNGGPPTAAFHHLNVGIQRT